MVFFLCFGDADGGGGGGCGGGGCGGGGGYACSLCLINFVWESSKKWS